MCTSEEMSSVDGGANGAKSDYKSYAADLKSLGKLARDDSSLGGVSKPEQIWRFLLGVSAFLELLSYVLPFFFLPQDDYNEVDESKPRQFLFFPKKVEVVDVVEEWSMSQWFDNHRYRLGVLFSCLWFVHSFVSANEARRKSLRRKDREALMRDDDDDDDDDSSKNGSGDNKEGINGASSTEDTTSYTYDDVAYNYGGSWGVFAWKASWYLMLLPVGFYMLSLLDFREIFLGDGGDDDTVRALVAGATTGASGEDLTLNASDDAATFSERVATKQTRYCLAYAAFVYTAKTASIMAGAAVRTRTVSLAKRLAARMTKFAVRNPRRAKRRLTKALTVLRWVKYLLPLIGTGNKLLGNTKDLIKKYHQSRRANEAKLVRQKLWRHLTPEERLERAAVVIQANFRSHRVQKAQRALRLIQMERRDAAVLRIQGILRKKAAAARVRVMKKKKELRELRMEQLNMKKHHQGRMSAESRRRMYQLQDQLGIEFQKSGARGLLLRPNTRFAVTWKVLFVVCVMLEISHLAVKPRLAKYKDKETGKPLTTGLVLEHLLVPDPTEERAECVDPSAGKKKKKKKSKRFGKSNKEQDDAMDSNIITAGGGGYYGPWYCSEPFRTSSHWFASAVRYLIQKSIVLVGIICFMDVFVTFFTGELDDDTGVLKPKPFFARWLLPGLVLQLLVNPMMVDVAAGVHKVRRGVHHVGPARVWRWCEACLGPGLGMCAAWFEWNVWRRFVKEKNVEIVGG